MSSHQASAPNSPASAGRRCAVLALVLAAYTRGAAASSYAYLTGSDLTGTDISGGTNIPTVAACAAECDSNSQCVAFSIAPGGGTCWLKNGAVSMTSSSQTIGIQARRPLLGAGRSRAAFVHTPIVIRVELPRRAAA